MIDDYYKETDCVFVHINQSGIWNLPAKSRFLMKKKQTKQNRKLLLSTEIILAIELTWSQQLLLYSSVGKSAVPVSLRKWVRISLRPELFFLAFELYLNTSRSFGRHSDSIFSFHRTVPDNYGLNENRFRPIWTSSVTRHLGWLCTSYCIIIEGI